MLSLFSSSKEATTEEKLQKTNNAVAKFPSLQADLLVNDDNNEQQLKPFVLNSEEPIPIENGLFVGQAMLILKPLQLSDDPNYHHRIGIESTTFVFQLQGRFKKSIPHDELMIGAQTTTQLTILDNSLWMKNICNWVLQCLAMRMDSPMTHSFGSDKTNENDDGSLPHISLPLHSSMETIIQTSLPTTMQAGNDNISKTSTTSKIPLLGTPFKDFKDLSDDLMTNKFEDDQCCWDSNVVYSMEYTADAVDLANWKIIFPLEMDLSRLWGASPMRLVIYHQQNEEEENKRDYAFNLQLKHLSNSKNSADTNHVATAPSSIFTLPTKFF